MEGAEADERAAEGEEGQMDVGAAFVTDAQAAELVKPAQGTFDDPAGFTQTAAMGSATASQLVFNALLAQPAVVSGTAISSVALDNLGAVPWTSGLALQRGDGAYQRFELATVMHVGRRQLDA